MKHYYLKTWLLHLSTFIMVMIGLGISAIFFITANQSWIMPVASNFLSRQRIPFNWIVSNKDVSKVVKVSGMKLTNHTYTYKDKQQLLSFVGKYSKYAIKYKDQVVETNDYSDYFSDSFSTAPQYESSIRKMLKTPHSSINDVIATELGSDNQGKFVILDYIIQSDDPLLYNYQVKMYYDDKFGSIKFTKYAKTLTMIKNKGGLPELYTRFNNASIIDAGYQSVQEFFSKLDLSNVYNDYNHLDSSVKFKNLTNGMNRKSKKSLEQLINISQGNFDNYALSEYTIRDVPDEVHMKIKVGGLNKVYRYDFTYSNAKKAITEIKSEN